MNFRKTAASLTALMCSAGVLSVFPASVENVGAADVVFNDFEVNYNGWHGSNTSVELTAVDGIGFAESRGMAVTNRAVSTDGAESTKGLYLMGGIEYTYSVQVKSDSDETFTLSMLCQDIETDKETTVILAEKKVKAGEWTELTASYTAPQNACEFRLSLTTDSTDDFTFDNFTITEPVSGMTAKAVTAQQGLKDEFANYFRVGNILNGGTVKNSAITGRLLKDCNAIECENETKPDATLVQGGSSNSNINVSLNSCSAIADFCATNGLGFRGHTMVWHSQTPQWFFKDNFQDGGNWVSSSVMDQRMESYIKNMFAAFAQKYPDLNLYAYDICNECVSDDSNRTKNNGGARTPGYGNGNSPWVQVYGSNIFVEKAFTYADKYAPDNCKLFYNDYNEYWDHKRDCIYNMCKSLYEKGVLDGVGMQSHINADMYGFSGIDAYTTAMKKYLSIGCDVQITELDVTLLDNKQVKYTTDQQAAKYKAVFQAAKDWNDNPQSTGRVTLVQVWGPDDGNSWLGGDAKGLLYNSNGQPKTAYNSVTSIVPQSEWGDGSHFKDGFEPAPIEPDSNGYYFHDTFEGSLGSWSGRGDATIMTSGRTAYEGNEALLVQDRGAAWNGATMSLNSRAFKPGETYSFSTNVMYFDGGDQDTFYMKLQYVDGEGTTQYSTIAEGTANNGSWAQLKNENYTIPSDATQMQLYVETAESKNNFYIDDAYGAVAGTKINGAGEAKNIIRGDVNFDGVVDIFDVASAKKVLTGRLNDNNAKKAADVDGNGNVQVNDIIQLQNFVMRRSYQFSSDPITTTAATTTTYRQTTITTTTTQPSNPLGIKDYGTPMNSNATAVADFRKGSTPLFFASDGWTNGKPFDCWWYKENTSLANNMLTLTIDKERNANDKNPDWDPAYSGAEYRTTDFYGFGYYETSMQAIKNDGVVSSFFTYTGPSDNNPWDEIDIEILGKDTTKVQLNYYTNGEGNHEYMYNLGFDASQGFHTYGFDWQRDHITWYVDGKAVYTAYNNIPVTPGKIMMNTWPGRTVDEWLKAYDGKTPLSAHYQWVTYNKQ